MSAGERGSTKLRIGLAVAVALACVGVGMVAWGDAVQKAYGAAAKK